jgi:DNA uptake protein ComE-like DNA-binding protein
MKSIFKYLYFNKNERLALLVFLVVLLLVNVGYQLLKTSKPTVNYKLSDRSINWIHTNTPKVESDFHKKKPQKSNSKSISNKIVTPVLVNINLADSIEFRKLKGIGEVFSSRIVRYRNWLGGFYCKEQLLEVYGIDSVLYQRILPHLKVSINDLRKINVNTCSNKDLSSHPYVSYKIAKSILKYREHHGAYKSINDLKRIPLIDEELFRRIAYYLELE